MPGGRLAAFLVAAATALVILGVSILPFLTSDYVLTEQHRAGVERLTGFDEYTLGYVTGELLGDLVPSNGDFDIAVGGTPVLTDRERAHMRDVRGVFLGFFGLVTASAVALIVTFRGARATEARAAAWRAVGSGARGLVIALAVAGAFALFAFDAAFEVFHRLFFSAGSYTFDPRTDRLVQLFPEQFWSDTAIAVGVVAVAAALVTAWMAGRRASAARPAAAFTTSTART